MTAIEKWIDDFVSWNLLAIQNPEDVRTKLEELVTLVNENPSSNESGLTLVSSKPGSQR